MVQQRCCAWDSVTSVISYIVSLFLFLDQNRKLHRFLNEPTFSRQCWPEPGLCFTFIVLDTSRQNQILVTIFTKSYNRPGWLCDNRFVQRNSQNTRLYARVPSASLSCGWHQHALFHCDISTVPVHAVQHSLSITANGTNFGRPLKTMKGASNFFHFQGITTRL